MTLEELKERQGWTLNQKIDHSLGTIDQFIQRLNGKVYVGFSGGKDSTVLLDLCRIVKPDIKAVFCNTGNEYPDIVRFVREMKATPGYNIDIIHPDKRPQQVMEERGFPLISKEVSRKVWYAKNRPDTKVAKLGLGIIPTVFYKIPDKYLYLLHRTYDVSNKCCDILKKAPFHKYERENKVAGILGIMASESLLRQTSYLRRGGCNVFNDSDLRLSKSLPLSIWLENDVLEYIQRRNLKIADIYHKGAKRTGCMFCGYGCQFADDNRLDLVYRLYPKWYDRFMNYKNNGVTYREALRELLKVNGLYLPDEQPQLELFTDEDF